MALHQLSLKLVKKEWLTPDVLELHFEKPANLSFLAGQFLQFLIPGETTPTPRSYSISSAPADDTLEFCIKILPQGKGSTYFSHMRVGQKITARGPLGNFTHTEHGSLECIATGVGITPIISIIRDELITKQSTESIHLLFGVREQKDIFWKDRLQALADTYSNFSYTITLSQGKTDPSWNGMVGRVTDHLHITPNASFYLCGNTDMVKDVRGLLKLEGVDQKKIRLEIF